MNDHTLRRALLLLTVLSTGCIWDPANRTEREKTSTFQVQGYTFDPGATVAISLRNYSTGQREQVKTAVSSTTEAATGLYFWSADITSESAPSHFWAPPWPFTIPPLLGPLSSGTTLPGRVEVTATSGGVQFGTFSNTARTCVANDPSQNYKDAGIRCHDGKELIQFDNTGIGQGPDTSTVLASQKVSGLYFPPAGAPGQVSAVWERVTYLSQGLTVQGIVCRPAVMSGSYPVYVYNHGGFDGVSMGEVGACLEFARRGWIAAMPAYRGETVPDPDSPHLQLKDSPFRSGGKVEVCLGEVTDSMRMLKAVQGTYSTDPNRVVMAGASHGGCVTSRALERGVAVKGAIVMAGPSDWAGVYNSSCVSSSPDCAEIKSTLNSSIGNLGSNASSVSLQRAYAWRSPGYKDSVGQLFVGDLAARKDVRMLIQHGATDTVVPVQQSCQLATDAWGDLPYVRLHVKPCTSNPLDLQDQGCPAHTETLAGCTQAAWDPDPRPVVWSGDRYLVVYKSIGHVLSNPMLVDSYAFIDSFNWGSAKFNFHHL